MSRRDYYINGLRWIQDNKAKAERYRGRVACDTCGKALAMVHYRLDGIKWDQRTFHELIEHNLFFTSDMLALVKKYYPVPLCTGKVPEFSEQEEKIVGEVLGPNDLKGRELVRGWLDVMEQVDPGERDIIKALSALLKLYT